MRVTCDANILVRGAMRPNGPARAVVDLSTQLPHVQVTSAEILAEARRALQYPRIKKKYNLLDRDVELFLTALQALADLVHLPVHMSSVVSDPVDNIVVATAVEGKAEVLCTRDHHLHHADVQLYCGNHGIRVMTDIELLPLLRSVQP